MTTSILKILSYNVWMMSLPLPGLTSIVQTLGSVSPKKTLRAKAIFASIPDDVDVIVLCESFCVSTTNLMFEQLNEKGFIHRTDVLGSRRRSKFYKFVNGGVVVFSKHPIVETDSLLYGSMGANDDLLSDKGVLYVKVAVKDLSVNIFATHTQAWPTEKATMVRSEQLRLMKNFADSKSIPSNEALLFTGDLNVNRFGGDYEYDPDSELHGNDEYKQMLSLLEAIDTFKVDDTTRPTDDHTLPTPWTEVELKRSETMRSVWTFNPATNRLAAPGPSSSGLYETLDYVLFDRNRRAPASYSCEVLDGQFKLTPNEAYRFKKGPCVDLSDHYPVCATLVFEDAVKVLPDNPP